MQNTDGKVVIEIDVRNSRAVREIDKVTKSLKKLEVSGGRSTRKIDDSMSCINRSVLKNTVPVNDAINGLSSSLKSLKAAASFAAAGCAALKLKDLCGQAVQTAAGFEQLGISFEVMTGSAQKGQALTDDYLAKLNEICLLQSKLYDMGITGQTSSESFTALKNQLTQAQTEVNKANSQAQGVMGVTWNNVTNTILSQLSTALTTPFTEGENALERFGNVALNVIQMIAQSMISNFLDNSLPNFDKKSITSILSVAGSAIGNMFGPIGGTIGGFIGGLFKNADGNAFYNGNVIPFATGGVVGSPTLFPMNGNKTGLMGENGAEAIMPLSRTSDGRLGVEAQSIPANVNIYNQTSSSIETIQRPDGDTDIFIRKVNNALNSERTNSGFTRAWQRQQVRGVQAS